MIHTDPAAIAHDHESALYERYVGLDTDALIDFLDSSDPGVAHAANLALRDRAQQTPADDATWALTGIPSDGNAPF